MNRLGALILIAAACLVGSVILHRRADDHSVKQMILNKEEGFRCWKCQHRFSMSGKKAMAMVRAGKTTAPADAAAAFPCPNCGKHAAYVDNSLPEGEKPTRPVTSQEPVPARGTEADALETP